MSGSITSTGTAAPSPGYLANLPLDRRLSLSAIAVGLLLRLYLGLTAEGYYFPDEVFQYIEPGHLIAFGRAAICWEYEYGMRSWALPGVLGGIMRTFDMIGVHHSESMWRIFRVMAGLLSVLSVVAADKIGRRIGGAWVGVTAAAFTAIYVPLLDLSPRLLADSLAGTLTVWALARIIDEDAPEREYSWSGGVFAVAAVMRLASGVAIVPPFVALVVKRDWRRLIAFCAPLAVIFLLSGILDWVTWGRPFNSWLTYVEMNFIRGAASHFGTAPNDAYLVMLVRTFDWLYPLALGAIIFGLRNSGRAGATLVLTYVFMSAVAHKEFRFTAGILPLLMIALANGVFMLAQMVPQERLRRIVLAGIIALLAVQNLNEVGDQEWGEGNDIQRAVAYVQHLNEVHGVFVATGRWFAAGDWMMHRNIPMMYMGSKESAVQDAATALQTSLLDIIVADDEGLGYLRSAGLNAADIRAVHKEGVWTIYRRNAPIAAGQPTQLSP